MPNRQPNLLFPNCQPNYFPYWRVEVVPLAPVASIIPSVDCHQYVVKTPMTVYKKVFLMHYSRVYADKFHLVATKVVIPLLIPIGAIVNETFAGPDKGKCRSNVAITLYDPLTNLSCYRSLLTNDAYPNVFGATVYPHTFSEKLKTCGGGIHFFKTKEEAQEFDLF